MTTVNLELDPPMEGMLGTPIRRQCDLCSPELSAQEFEEMLAELDAICRQARELSTQIKLQMVERARQDLPVPSVRTFPRPV